MALSRLKNLKNLRLLGFNTTAISIDGLALKADIRFQELSEEAVAHFTDDELDGRAKSFIEFCGGLTDEKEIEKLAKKQKAKASKKSTYELTKELIIQGMSLIDIGHERGITEGTIIGHITKLKSKDDSLDIEIYKPSSVDLMMIEAAYDELKKDLGKEEEVKLTPLFKALKGNYSFDEIRLAQLFL